jgi:hypothetical protein
MRSYVVYGLILWGVGSVVLRVAGQYLFAIPWIWGVGALTIIGIPFIVLRVTGRRATTIPARVQATVALALPGMVLDCISVSFAATLFPNIPASARTFMAGWLLLVYSVALLTPFLPLGTRDASYAASTDR